MRGERRSRDATRLRVAYRRRLLRLAARDLTGVAEVDDVAAELADLAAATLEAALAIARAELREARRDRAGWPSSRWASAAAASSTTSATSTSSSSPRRPTARTRPTALRTATPLAAAMMRVCSATTGEGTIWPVDAALRPEGKAGPLVRTLASHVAYYERWAKTWEFQALLKARPVAGDLALGAGVRRGASRRWSGRRPSGRTSSPTCSRCAAGSRSTLPAAARPTASSSSGPAGCATSSSPCSCCSSCTAAADDTLRSAQHAGGARGAVDRRLRRPRRRRRAGPRLPLPAHPRAPAAAAPAAAHPRDARGRGRAAPARPLARAAHATRSRSSTGEWRRHAREVRRLHEKLFYRPLLDAVARLAAERGAADARRRRGPGSRRSATSTRPARCGTSRR